METIQLDKTGLRVGVIGFGAMQLSIQGRPERAQALAVLHRALDLGVTFIDTADAYCLDETDKHHNEELIREALATYPGPAEAVVVATKGGFMRPSGQWIRDSHPDHLRQAIRRSHEALGGERPIPLWQHHAPDPRLPVEVSLAVVKSAVEEGLIRYVGVSNYSVDEIRRARRVIDIVSVQNQYNPWHRQPERDGVLAYCEREGLTFLPWSPFGGRGRAGRLGEIPALAAMAREKGRSPQQLVLAWMRAKSPCILPIPGASRLETLEDCLAAADLTLTPDEVARLDAAFDAL
ncbi:aldo/keto reductase [Rhodocaloribacter litoris]|uniref:aldo/keto reductase n=1 Tax=Rhodocaloribacter litoris TaxID=2558931 RepID=UPI00141E1CE5|nr:aldo/keto reductase [Rhodocaloribacter litoris]QXD14892.1 aldo/keto reductase [Rhodocaloribacter litoris]